MKSLLVAFLAATLFLSSPHVAFAEEEDHLFAVHGSGTTNPSKCFWLLMGQMMDRARDPVHLTYRAVGSSTGIAEFLGENNTGTGAFVAYNDFGSGDIPVPSHQYKALLEAGQEMLHFPFALGAISIFHSIPNVPQGTGGLNLTSCVIAKIFRRQITEWDNEEILNLNPNLEEKLPRSNYPIILAHRVKGSSSTASVTSYLNTSCSKDWDSSLVGSTIDWPSGNGILECEGSGGMTACIRDNPGAIGYIDSGHGHSEGLIEIELQNKDGTLLSSKEAASKGGIASAAENTVLPETFDQDFGQINYLDKAGESTWPITAMSYVFVRKNITYIEHPEEQGLLIAFLKSLYNDDVFEQCTQFGFTAAPQVVKDRAMAGIASITTSPDAPEWTFEESTTVGDGQGRYVISAKRRSGADVQREQLLNEIQDMKNSVFSVNQQVRTLSDGGNTFTDTDQRNLTAALVMASISFVLWGLLAVGFLAKRCMNI